MTLYLDWFWFGHEDTTHVKRTVSRCFAALRQLRSCLTLVLSRLCSLVFQAIFSTVYVDYSRYWMWRHAWSTTRDPRTTHQRSCLSSLAACPRADRLQGRCADIQSFTRKCAAVPWDHSFLLPIYPAYGHYALVAPVVCYCHLPGVQQSVTGHSRLQDIVSGTLQHRGLYQPSVNDLKLGFSGIHFPTSLSEPTF